MNNLTTGKKNIEEEEEEEEEVDNEEEEKEKTKNYNNNKNKKRNKQILMSTIFKLEPKQAVLPLGMV